VQPLPPKGALCLLQPGQGPERVPQKAIHRATLREANEALLGKYVLETHPAYCPITALAVPRQELLRLSLEGGGSSSYAIASTKRLARPYTGPLLELLTTLKPTA